jgi:CDP-diacylglycerol--serine O-phosphatidyltransferase
MTPRAHPRRGTYLLPTLFTTGNLFCGFTSLVQSAQGEFYYAAVLIILAGILDGLDGRIARITNSTSEFGFEFDSLADIVSFGIAPAFLIHQWGLIPLGRRGWMIAFLFVACAAMRLARFNIQRHVADKRYFVGLASPAAAAVLTCIAFAFPDGPGPVWVSVLVAGTTVATALLMVTRLRYRSFKDIDLKKPRSYLSVLLLAAAGVAIGLADPQNALLVLALAYMISGPIAYVWGLLQRGRRGPRAVPVGEVHGPAAR